MNPLRVLKSYCATFQRARAQRQALASRIGPAALNRAEWDRSLTDPTAFYFDCFRYFHQQLPQDLAEHRLYFSRKKRGFGEDAFHTMWFLLFREFKPRSFLEIGVYRGQTLSLAALLAQREQRSCHICGISPFASVGDSVSKYIEITDYREDTLRNFEAFKLPPPELVTSYSTDPKAGDVIRSRQWDIAYIDGNHDYDVARADWETCSNCVGPGGLIVLDDSGIGSAYRPPIFATMGHPGPSRVAAEVPRNAFREILQVGHNRVFQKLRQA